METVIIILKAMFKQQRDFVQCLSSKIVASFFNAGCKYEAVIGTYNAFIPLLCKLVKICLNHVKILSYRALY